MFFNEICEKELNNFCKNNNVVWNDKINIESYKISNDYDITTNAAMVLSKNFKRNPIELAKDICSFLNKNKYIKNADFASPGFININFEDNAFDHFYKLFQIDKKPIQDIFFPDKQNENICIEFVSANPTGYLHIGHARHAIFGDILTNIFTYSKINVKRLFYINDAGKQMQNLANSVFLRYLELCNKKTYIQILEEGYFGEEIINAANYILKKYRKKFSKIEFIENKISDDVCNKIFMKESYKFFLEAIKQDLKKINMKFDLYKKELDLIPLIPDMLKILKSKDLTYEKDGALFIKSSIKGDDKDRVLIKENEDYTYITSDACFFNWKSDQGWNKIITILGEDHHGYIPRLKAMIELLGKDIAKFDFPILRLVKLSKDGQEVKMSKRSGTSVWLRELLEEVGVDALRILMISNLKTTTIDFDIEKAILQNSNNPLYYCQYAMARCNQLELKSKKAKINCDFKNHSLINLNSYEKKLFIFASELDKIIKLSKNSFEPYFLFNYLMNMVKNFHSYYNNNQIIDPNNIETTKNRLIIVRFQKIILEEIFRIMGIKSIKKM